MLPLRSAATLSMAVTNDTSTSTFASLWYRTNGTYIFGGWQLLTNRATGTLTGAAPTNWTGVAIEPRNVPYARLVSSTNIGSFAQLLTSNATLIYGAVGSASAPTNSAGSPPTPGAISYQTIQNLIVPWINNAGNVVLTNALNSTYFYEFFTNDFNTNVISPVQGFDQAGMNHDFYWDAALVYTDSIPSVQVGGYTNSFGWYIVLDSSAGNWAAETDPANGLVDFTCQYFTGGQTLNGPSDWGINTGVTAGSMSYKTVDTNLVITVLYADNAKHATNSDLATLATTANDAIAKTYTSRQGAIGFAPDVYWNLTMDGGAVFPPNQGTNCVVNLIAWIKATPGMSGTIDTIHIDNTNQQSCQWITNGMIQFIHTNGYVMEWWLGEGNTVFFNNLGYPMNFYREIEWAITNGIDGITLDGAVNSAAELPEPVEIGRLKSFAEGYAGTYGYQFQVSKNGGYGGTWGDAAHTVFWGIPYQTGLWHWNGGGFDLGAANFVDELKVFYSSRGSLNFQGKGHFPYWSDTDNAFFDTNLMKNALALASINPIVITLYKTNWVTNPQAIALWTNMTWRAVYKDPDGNPGFLIFSNKLAPTEIYGRHLRNGDTAVAFINSGSTATNQTVAWQQLGFLPGAQVIATDCLENTNIVITSGNSFAVTIPATTVKLWRLSAGSYAGATQYFAHPTNGIVTWTTTANP